jgi:type III secretion protein J
MPVRDTFSRSAAWPARLLGLLALLCLLCACKTTLYAGLSEVEINEMLVVLSTNGIAAQKVDAGKGLWNLSVEERLLPRSVDILTANGYPRYSYKTMGDVFKKDGMVSTPTEEKARLVYAITQELSGTIATLDGVLAARVHIVLPEVDNFGNKISQSTASVFIKHRADVDLTAQVSPIKRMVENSVRDLKYESISVFLFPSSTPPPLPLPPETTVLGIVVDPDNATMAWLLVAVLFLALAGGGGAAAWHFLKRKKKAAAEG